MPAPASAQIGNGWRRLLALRAGWRRLAGKIAAAAAGTNTARSASVDSTERRQQIRLNTALELRAASQSSGGVAVGYGTVPPSVGDGIGRSVTVAPAGRRRTHGYGSVIDRSVAAAAITPPVVQSARYGIRTDRLCRRRRRRCANVGVATVEIVARPPQLTVAIGRSSYRLSVRLRYRRAGARPEQRWLGGCSCAVERVRWRWMPVSMVPAPLAAG